MTYEHFAGNDAADVADGVAAAAAGKTFQPKSYAFPCFRN